MNVIVAMSVALRANDFAPVEPAEEIAEGQGIVARHGIVGPSPSFARHHLRLLQLSFDQPLELGPCQPLADRPLASSSVSVWEVDAKTLPPSVQPTPI